jgi:hypothetical protein
VLAAPPGLRFQFRWSWEKSSDRDSSFALHATVHSASRSVPTFFFQIRRMNDHIHRKFKSEIYCTCHEPACTW